jgi:hypothetical protein
MLVSPTHCEQGGTNLRAALQWPSLATATGGITEPPIADVALSSSGRMTSHSRCYRPVTVPMGDDVMSPALIAIEGHNRDGWFGDITEELLSNRPQGTRCCSRPPTTVLFCSSVMWLCVDDWGTGGREGV